MPYYLGKVPLRAELPELAEEVNAAKTSPQQAVGLRRRLCDGIFSYSVQFRSTLLPFITLDFFSFFYLIT